VADRKLIHIVHHILTAAGDDHGVSDAELLQRFTGQGDAAAFELLVWRYQRLVLGICRRVLRDLHDAEDAFQATFLILARKAGSIGRRQALGGWLYQVATRAALAARAARSKRATRERSLGGDEAAAASEAEALAERQELATVVDEEVSRLPERFRAAVVLCYFEGKTVEEAARQLECPRGTVASRLARARERLRIGLTRRGLALTSGTLAAGLSQAGFAGATAEGLVRRTGQAITALSAGRTAAEPALSRSIIALSEEVLRSMFIRKITTGAAILVVGLLVLGGGLVLWVQGSAEAEPAPLAAASDAPRTPEDTAAPAIVSQLVRREVATEKPPTPLPVRLRQIVDFIGMDDKNTTLQEGLDFICDRYDLAVEVNDVAFKAEGVDDVLSQGITRDKPLNKMKQVPLEVVVRRMLARVSCDSGAAFLLRRNTLEITTGARARAEIWGPDYKGPFLPLVHTTFERRPLDMVLREWEDTMDFSILVDKRVADKAKAEVSGRFVNTPLDTAVLFLADMAELRPVLIDNTLYVTTRENAAVLEARERAKQEGKDKTVPRIGLGRLAPFPAEGKP
jgi:RNA polymerase sigma factor (sigma-70 family)